MKGLNLRMGVAEVVSLLAFLTSLPPILLLLAADLWGVFPGDFQQYLHICQDLIITELYISDICFFEVSNSDTIAAQQFLALLILNVCT